MRREPAERAPPPGKVLADTLERPKSLRDLAATRLRAAIIDAELAFGELLSESVIGETFGISKTPVHEALVQLQAEGLVEILPQRGARVFQPTSQSVRDICDHRVLLETHAARLAYERNRSRLIKGLRAVVSDMRRAWTARDVREYLRLDTAYHDLFYQLSGSPCLAAAYGLIAARAAAIRTQIVAPKPDSRRMAFDEHRAIPGLLEQGRIEQVVNVLTLHVSRLKDLFGDGPDPIVEHTASRQKRDRRSEIGEGTVSEDPTSGSTVGLTRRRTLVTAGAAALASMALPPLARPALARKARIVYWTPNDPNGKSLSGRGERAMLDVFEKANPDIEVEVQPIPWQVMGQQVIQAVMGGGGPDVVQLSTTELADQVAAGTTLPLDDIVGKHWSAADKDDFLLPWSNTVYDGAKMAFFWSTVLNNHLYYVREDTGGEPPLDMDEFARSMSPLSQKLGKAGFLTSLSQEGNSVVFFNWLVPLLWSCGADYLAPDGTIAFLNDGGERALGWLAELVAQKVTPRSIVSLTRQNVMDAIQARKAMTTLAASNTVETVRASLGAGLGLAMQPGAKGPCPAFAVGKPLIVTRTSNDPSAAGKLIEALISPEAQLAHARTSHDIPSRRSVLADPWFRDPAAADIKVATDYIQTSTRPFKFSKGTSTLQISLALAAQQVVDGRKVREALDQVAREWDAHRRT